MPAAFLDFRSLACARTQLLTAPTQPYYVVVLLVTSHSPAAAPVLSHLYVGGPGQLPQVLAQVPAHAQGQVLRFTDDLLYATGTTSELLLSLFYGLPTGEPLALSPEPAAEIAFLLASLQQHAASEPLVREALQRAYLHTLLLRCCSLRRQQLPPPTYPARPGLFLRFRQLLEQYYTEWKSVTAYADQLCVTPNHLSVSIKRETGRPAGDYIRQRIMLEAQRLAAVQDAPLKEVAYQLGFEDAAHFSKLFKRCHGVSFSSFKAQVRQQPVLAHSPQLRQEMNEHASAAVLGV
jgi:AraC family transcriptional activator of pobA